jgi:hypothetical protein
MNDNISYLLLARAVFHYLAMMKINTKWDQKDDFKSFTDLIWKKAYILQKGHVYQINSMILFTGRYDKSNEGRE